MSKTMYHLSVQTDDQELASQIIADLRDTNNNAQYAFKENGGGLNEISWPEVDTHMKDFSTRHPDTVIELFTDGGEDGTETSITYYKNGKMQYCPAVVTFDEFNADLLN